MVSLRSMMRHTRPAAPVGAVTIQRKNVGKTRRSSRWSSESSGLSLEEYLTAIERQQRPSGWSSDKYFPGIKRQQGLDMGASPPLHRSQSQRNSLNSLMSTRHSHSSRLSLKEPDITRTQKKTVSLSDPGKSINDETKVTSIRNKLIKIRNEAKATLLKNERNKTRVTRQTLSNGTTIAGRSGLAATLCSFQSSLSLGHIGSLEHLSYPRYHSGKCSLNTTSLGRHSQDSSLRSSSRASSYIPTPSASLCSNRSMAMLDWD